MDKRFCLNETKIIYYVKMASVSKGDFSIHGISKAKIGGNILETIYTGSSVGLEGHVKFQEAILNTVEAIIKNRLDANYTRAPILLLADQPTIGETTHLSLFAVHNTVTQTEVPSKTLFQDYLLKVDSLTQGSTTTITDSSMVKLAEYISDQAFVTLEKASSLVASDESTLVSFSDEEVNGRLRVSIENSVFTIRIVIQ